MIKTFNTEGVCIPSENYMVNLDERLHTIKAQYIDKGKYFTINRARQYGKTTTLSALATYLRGYYDVIEMDFQMFSHADFEEESAFVSAFSREILALHVGYIPKQIEDAFIQFLKNDSKNLKLGELFQVLSLWCTEAARPIVLIIDEIDSATNNQVFLDFLAQLRGYYIHRKKRATFQSVILAGVHDVKNLKQKIHTEEEHKLNSPWNIAADFNVDMSFSVSDIKGMLLEYEEDHQTGMNIELIAGLIYDYTSGYPFLVSRICKIIDEKLAGSAKFQDYAGDWTLNGVSEAVKQLLVEKNTLFESLMGKVNAYSGLREALYTILFTGKSIAYNPDNEAIDVALMYGFIKNINGSVVISNRIFETRLYNYFLSAGDVQNSAIYKAALQDKNQFIQNGHLNMELVLEKFVTHFDELYGDQSDTFKEEDGRRYFLLYLRPIINGTGNYYIEARTRNMERTDVIVDYHGEQFVIEMKIWRGNAYNERGEAQLTDYLNHYHLKKGYIVSFSFNKNKKIGLKRILFGDKELVEAVV